MTNAEHSSSPSTSFAPPEIDHSVASTHEIKDTLSATGVELLRHKSLTEPSSSLSQQTITGHQDLTHLSRSMNKVASSAVASLVRSTQHATDLGDDILLKHLAQIYRELGESRSQIEHMARLLRNFEGFQQTRLQSSFDGIEADDIVSRDSKSESDASEIFLDCVSRFSEGLSDTSIECLRMKFAGIPDYLLERSSMFFPPIYTAAQSFATVSVAAMKELRSSTTHRVHKYFLIYDFAPRAWQKVTVDASIITLCRNSAFLGLGAQYDAVTGRRFLPGDFRRQLETIIQSQGNELLYPVTNLSLTVTENAAGEVSVDETHVSVTKDLSESQTDNELILHAVDAMDCPQFLQSEVITRRRRGAYTSIVQVEKQLCFEYRIPFTGAGLPGHNRVREFYYDLEKLYRLRDCCHVAKFVGVVLDDTRKHVKSYLKEFPRLNSLMTVFADAERQGKRIPWSIREIWAKHIISAVEYAHRQQLTVDGLYTLHNIGLRSDGNAILMGLGTQYMGFNEMNQRGQMPPELRTRTNNEAPQGIHFRQDIFSLGLALWLLAEHKAGPEGYYCRVNACTNWPRYACSAAHSNPVELPRCTDNDVPEHFNTVIRHCRQSRPGARPSARKLLRYFDQVEAPPDLDNLVDSIVNEYQVKLSFDCFAVCDECGRLIVVFHHCAICKVGNFDLCTECVSSGVHCYVQDHQLIEHKIIGY